jgi:crotonobetainyl-CoA:carnitine CoA-transferase CaiB-like acyl-CoA transferase
VKPLEGVRVVSTALNVPGPAACARLRDLGAAVTKVEPPPGDPLEAFSGDWYRRLHAGIEVERIDLKDDAQRPRLHALLARADVLVTAQRPAAFPRLGLDALGTRYPHLCHVAIVGYPPPDEGLPGHDLSYMAEQGLVARGRMPRTLFVDMAGAERAVSTALALLAARARGTRELHANVALSEVAAFLAQPLSEGLTRRGAILGGAHPGYNLYAAKDGWLAVAALEPHFEKHLAEALGLASLSAHALTVAFKRETAVHWEDWARRHDLPIVALRKLEDLP